MGVCSGAVPKRFGAFLTWDQRPGASRDSKAALLLLVTVLSCGSAQFASCSVQQLSGDISKARSSEHHSILQELENLYSPVEVSLPNLLKSQREGDRAAQGERHGQAGDTLTAAYTSPKKSSRRQLRESPPTWLSAVKSWMRRPKQDRSAALQKQQHQYVVIEDTTLDAHVLPPKLSSLPFEYENGELLERMGEPEGQLLKRIELRPYNTMQFARERAWAWEQAAMGSLDH